MIKKYWNKIVSLTLLLVLILTFSPISSYNVFSAESDIISVSDCEELSNYWLSLNYNDGTVIDEIIPISDGVAICSYCVNFINNGEPRGYIVIDSYRYAADNITEFSFAGPGIYDTLCNNYGVSTYSLPNNKIIYATGIYDYAISTSSRENTFYSSTGDVLDKETLDAYCDETREFKEELRATEQADVKTRTNSTRSLVDYRQGFFNSSKLPSNVSYTEKIITGASSFTPTTMTTYRGTSGNTGNCAPTAGANMLSYYMEKRGYSNLGTSRQNIYNRIVTASGWNYNTSGAGGMSKSQLKLGLDNVISASWYNYHYEEYTGTTSYDYWSEWVTDLNSNCPVLTIIYGNRPNEYGSWINVGHEIVTVGYRTYDTSVSINNGVTFTGTNFMIVWDGWNNYARYLLYNVDSLTSIQGICVKVTQ